MVNTQMYVDKRDQGSNFRQIFLELSNTYDSSIRFLTYTIDPP